MNEKQIKRFEYLKQNYDLLSDQELQEYQMLEAEYEASSPAETTNGRSRKASRAAREQVAAMEVAKEVRHKKIKKKKRKWPLILGLVVLALLLIGGGVAAYMYTNATGILKKTFIQTDGTTNTIQADKPLTMVLLGVDTGDASRGDSWEGNSDSQIVVTLNPKTKTTTMVSMERDTMTNIIDGNGQTQSTQKMNAAYPSGYNAGGLNGAVTYAMSTIGQESGIKLDNFMTLNMDGLVNLVNDVGGIDVVNDSGSTITIANTEPEYTATVPYIGAGKSQHINGDQALVFARDRDTLPNGDYGRTAHQREVIQQVMKKLLSMNSLPNYEKILNDISHDFKTNISINASNLTALLAYKDCFNKVVSVQYQGISGTDDNGTSYQFMPQNVTLAVQNLLRTSVGDSALSQLGDNVITYESYYGVGEDEMPNYFMPSATITEKGKTPVTYGINTDGSLVNINSSNASTYVGTNGSAVGTTSSSDDSQ